MTDNQSGTLRFISETHRSSFRHRSSIIWKVLLSALSLFVLIVYAELHDKLKLKEALGCVGAMISIFLLVFFTILYLWHLHRACHINNRFAELAESALIDSTEQKALKDLHSEVQNQMRPQKNLLLPTWRWWAFILQAIFVIAFALITSLVVLH